MTINRLTGHRKNAPAIHALIFDVFGTVVDWRSGVGIEIGNWFGPRGITLSPFAFADEWRAQYQPAMTRVRAGGRGYVPLDILHRENLEISLSRHGLERSFTHEEKDEMNTAWEKLPPWPDCAEGLRQLRARHIVAPCSNGSIALMARLARYGGLQWDAIVGADIARNYKPKPETYLKSCDALGLRPQEVMMVAAHADDLVAAAACGLRTAFVHRPHEFGGMRKADEPQPGRWDLSAASLIDLAAQLTLL